MTQYFISVEDEDVVWVDANHSAIMNMRTMFRKDEFEELALYKITGVDARQWDSEDPSVIAKTNWAKDGVDCDALLLSKGKWMHGKVKARVVLEFYPDEELQASTPVQTFDDSPLDDIRQSIQ